MYSDTHFHFFTLTEGNAETGSEILSEMAKSRASFALDVGRRADDLAERIEHFEESLNLIEDSVLRGRAKKMTYFSAGIAPDEDSIQNGYDLEEVLEEQIEDTKRLAAIGECGLDHVAENFWEYLEEERDLFLMQIKIAKKLQLPLIIHSKEAFEDTLSCLDEGNYHKGIIHNFSYGEKEAKAFLDRGYYISLAGDITYTKKNNLYELENLLRYIPDNRLLVESNAPHYAPVPFKGDVNTPLLIRYTYDFIAAKKGITVEKLCKNVDENCKLLFKI